MTNWYFYASVNGRRAYSVYPVCVCVCMNVICMCMCRCVCYQNRVWAITLFLDWFWNYLAEKFKITRWSITRKTQVHSFKVKVTFRGQRSKIGFIFRVQTITLSFLYGFWNYFAEMLTIMRQSTAHKTQVGSSKIKIKVTLSGQR